MKNPPGGWNDNSEFRTFRKAPVCYVSRAFRLKFMKTLFTLFFAAATGLLGFVAGKASGYAKGARSEGISALVFLLKSREMLDLGDPVKAMEVLDTGLNAFSGTLLEIEAGNVAGLTAKAVKADPEVDELKEKLRSGVDLQRTPVPAKLYQFVGLPVVEGGAATPGPQAAPAPGGSPAAPENELPPGIFRRER